MEHAGRIWFGDDDPSTSTRAVVDLSSDGRVVIRAGDRIDFEPDDRENPDDKDKW